MIYLEETFDLEPASPETLDRFVEFAQGSLLPAYQRLGARLAAAWTCNSERFGQVKQVLEFDDLGALGAFREEASNDESWAACAVTIEDLAPVRNSRLMESLAPIPPETTHAAAAESQKSAVGAYSLAILRVRPGMMSEFMKELGTAASMFPIVASWRTIAGRSNEVTDVWKGALGQAGYQPAAEAMKPFFRNLREIAPDEKLLNVYPLPYSPLL